MGKIPKLTEEYFIEVKDDLSWYRKRWTTDKRIAKKRGISLKTVLQIKGSDSYEDYLNNVRAQHPPVKFSLRDHVLVLHRKEFGKDNEAYIEPLTARQAIVELLNKENR